MKRATATIQYLAHVWCGSAGARALVTALEPYVDRVAWAEPPCNVVLVTLSQGVLYAETNRLDDSRFARAVLDGTVELDYDTAMNDPEATVALLRLR